ncbi:MAG TPA: beta-phosphoglucomutase family hydrolase [Labilithrix sp.]|nr:beta-phosphoglucomutase family hydrolase [Labilithrix sp.]
MYGLPSNVRACLFDLDGVLTPTAEVHGKAWKMAFDAYLEARARRTSTPLTPFTAGDYERYVDGKPRADGVRAFLTSRGLSLPEGQPDDLPGSETVHGLANAKNDAFERLLRDEGVAPYEGSKRYVRAVRSGGMRTAVVSSSRHCRQVLDAAQIADLFDAIVDGVARRSMKLAGKPAPDTYLAAARELGFAPGQAAVFEDALAGVEAGRAGAFACVVGVDRIGHSAELLRHGADVVVKDLAELLVQP